jgi:DNA topoisomerase-1
VLISACSIASTLSVVPAVDSEALASSASLRYVSDDEPGLRRRRRGKGFSYESDTGASASEQDRARAAKLAIPPAWTDVWICKQSNGHIQATGRDQAERKQYLYHSEWERVRDEAKFDRMADFGRVLPPMRKQIHTDLGRRGLDRTRVIALALAVLDQTLIRIGNTQYANDNGSFGLTTLKVKHADVEGGLVRFSFKAKGGVTQDVALRDPRLAAMVSRCQELKGQRLFSYLQGDETAFVTSDDVNDYVRDAVGEFTAKDFRTWGASALALAHLGALGRPEGNGDSVAILEAIDHAAKALGNTRAVCRDSYIHPAIAEAYSVGALTKTWHQTRTGRWMTRAERTLMRILG